MRASTLFMTAILVAASWQHVAAQILPQKPPPPNPPTTPSQQPSRSATLAESAAAICKRILQAPLKTTDLTALVARMSSSPRKLSKDEFETSAAHEKRLAEEQRDLEQYLVAAGGERFVVVTHNVEGAKYNADKGAFEIGETFEHYTTKKLTRRYHVLSSARTASYLSTSELALKNKKNDVQLDGYHLIVPKRYYELSTLGTYEAENAFRMKKVVLRQSLSETGVYFYFGESDELFGGRSWISTGQPILMKMNAEKARAAKEHIGVLLAGSLMAPFYHQKRSRQSPAFDAPIDRTEQLRAVVARPECAAIIDLKSGEVLLRLR